MTLNRIREMILKRDFKEALQEILRLSDVDRIEGQTYKGLILSKQKNFADALAVIDDVLSEEGLKPSKEFIARIGKILISLRMNSYLDAFSEIDPSDHLLDIMSKKERASVKRWEGHLLSTKGMLQIITGDQH
ncbi:MAG: hypothetical protein KAR33_09285, partial [Candidatus Thorarchaeota archaeon]|nr:hypothetical protein [Candidatus Thorarchaeota archaeon]